MAMFPAGWGCRWRWRSLACYFGLGSHRAMDVLASAAKICELRKDYLFRYPYARQAYPCYRWIVLKGRHEATVLMLDNLGSSMCIWPWYGRLYKVYYIHTQYLHLAFLFIPLTNCFQLIIARKSYLTRLARCLSSSRGRSQCLEHDGIGTLAIRDAVLGP